VGNSIGVYLRSSAVLTSLLLSQMAAAREVQDTWSGVERVVAVGDVHGDYDQFVAVLRSAKLIDGAGKWSGGKTHLVQTGDALDRGTDGRKVMDLLMKLEQQASRAGGRVHALIGNHEAMNLYGDLRYVAPQEYETYRDKNSEKLREKAYKRHQEQLKTQPPPGGLLVVDEAYRKKWESEHPLGFFERQTLFAPEGTYGKWIRGHNAIVKIGQAVFLHGGIGPKYAAYSLKMINDRVREELDDFQKLQGGMVTDPDGPLWYRGLAGGDEPSLEENAKKVLANLGVERIVIGHTVTDGTVVPRFGGKVLMIDIGLSRVYDSAGRMACLVIENDKPYALQRGARVELPAGAKLLPQQLFDLRRRQAPVFADRQVADADCADGGSHQLQRLAADGFHHAPHLAVAAFGDRDLHE
jgi:hypothetical protein